jgi:hypothetical protein
MVLRKSLWPFLVTLLAGAWCEARAELIYDNTTTRLGTSLLFSALQMGDEVQAAGTARLVSELQVGVSQQGTAGTADLRARLYANDGPAGQPGSLLWESALRDDVALTGGIDLIAFPVPLVLVPDTFTWTIQISDARPIAVGLPFFHPPTVGSSPDYAWFGGPGSWTRQTVPSPVNLMARVTAVGGAGAVPEPSSAALALAGLAGLAFAALGTRAAARRAPALAFGRARR